MTKKQRMMEFYQRMDRLGIAYEDVETLRKIEMTLSRWGEHECNGTIQRDEETGKPYHWFETFNGGHKRSRFPIADREKGALKRLEKIMAKYPQYRSYYQTDPRGCSLYIVPVKDIPEGKDIDAYYSRGYAVCY